MSDREPWPPEDARIEVDALSFTQIAGIAFQLARGILVPVLAATLLALILGRPGPDDWLTLVPRPQGAEFLLTIIYLPVAFALLGTLYLKAERRVIEMVRQRWKPGR